jgi:Na+-driven multidrug efflux pump
LPSAAQQLLVSLGTACIVIFINGYGASAMAGFTAASQMDMVAFFIALSMSMAISTLVGQNIGAGRFDRVRAIFRWGLLVNGGMVGVVSVLVVIFAPVLMLMFTKPNTDAYYIGVSYLHIVGFSYIFFAIMFVAVGVINGAGHTMVTTGMTLIGLWLVRIPLAWFLSRHFGTVGIWYAVGSGFAVSMVLALGYYATGRWKVPVVHHKPTVAQAEPGEPGVQPPPYQAPPLDSGEVAG